MMPFDVEGYIEYILERIDSDKGTMTDREVYDYLSTWGSGIDLGLYWKEYAKTEGDGTLWPSAN